MTDERELMKAAFQAILRGDYAERDRLCAEAERVIKMKNNGPGFVKAATERPIMINRGDLIKMADGSYRAKNQ